MEAWIQNKGVQTKVEMDPNQEIKIRILNLIT